MTKRDINIKDIEVEEQQPGAFHASWCGEITKEFAGCPLGRGRNPDAAIFDLLARTSCESQITLTLKG